MRGTGASRNPYYTVGDKVFLTAVDACKENHTADKEMHFHPGLNFLDSPEWRTEPPESIQEIRLERARQIRDEYDNVILMFSGGTDSTPMLRTFVENGIKIDKIKIGQVGEWATLRAWEFDTLIFPELKKYLHDHNYSVPVEVSSRHTFLEDHARAWETLDQGPCPVLTPTGFTPWMTHDAFGFGKEKGKACAVYGREKPFITVSDGYWCWIPLDKILFSQETNLNNEYVAVEEFYLTDKMPKIQIKLAWLKAKFLEKSVEGLLDLDGLERDGRHPLDNLLREHTGDLLALQGSQGRLYQGCCAAMNLLPIHPWLATMMTHPTNPELWPQDLRSAFQDHERLLLTFEANNKEIIEELPDRYFNEDDLCQDLFQETRVLSGIFGMPVRMKPFSKLKEEKK